MPVEKHKTKIQLSITLTSNLTPYINLQKYIKATKLTEFLFGEKVKRTSESVWRLVAYDRRSENMLCRLRKALQNCCHTEN